MNHAIIEMNDFADAAKTNPIQTQSNPIKPNFKGKKEKDFAAKPQIRDEKTNKKC